VLTQRSKTRVTKQPADPCSIERGVRQFLADKVCGNLLGLWLLVPEHLRLGTWGLLCDWSQQPGPRVEPRLALQVIHEACLCLSGVRPQRQLTHKGFELVNGLPFLASDLAIHELLAAHTSSEAQRLQVALGQRRWQRGHFQGRLLAVDPHRVVSYSKRRMRPHCLSASSKPIKMAQTFFSLDAESKQPVCFTTATAARTVSQATPELLNLAAEILGSGIADALAVADGEHFTAELLDRVREQTPFQLLVPMAKQASLQKRLRAIPDEMFRRQWAGYATAKLPYEMVHSRSGPMYQLVQRQGERPEQWRFNAFLCTADHPEVDLLTKDYPQRWHIEEFFEKDQALGWQRAGTQNLNIRYGQMTLALLGQAVLQQLRQRLGAPYASWQARHLAQGLLGGLEGDVRVEGNTIVVSYYNAPEGEQWRQHYEGLPGKLRAEGIAPEIPWLYGYQLDFRFR
jgi:Transposase DDE domain